MAENDPFADLEAMLGGREPAKDPEPVPSDDMDDFATC